MLNNVQRLRANQSVEQSVTEFSYVFKEEMGSYRGEPEKVKN